MISESLELFSIDLLKILISKDKNGNIFSSPLSIMTAFSMLLMGTKNESKEQLIKTLKIDSKSLEIFHQNIGDFIEKCVPPISQYDDTRLSIANGLFVQKDFQINDQYKSGLLQYYKSEIGEMNFEDSATVKKMNQWIEDKTNQKIKNMFKEGSFSSLTRLVLANAVYFKGNFSDSFSLETTMEKPFYLDNNNCVNVQMMSTGGSYNYVQDDKIKLRILSIPFKNYNYRFLLFLPIKRFGLEEAIVNLQGKDLKHLTSSLQLRFVSKLEVPKFKIETTIDLNGIISSLGAVDIFDHEKANLSGISNIKLFVDKAVHKTFLDVNEHGVEAAAATALTMCCTSIPMYADDTPVEFVVDEPFLLAVYNSAIDAILFLGRIYKP